MSLPLLLQCRHALRLGMDHLIDRRWGIDTLSGTWALPTTVGKFNDARPNVPISYFLLFQFLGRMVLKPDDVFYDIGCGNGRVLCYIARRRIAKVIGVELCRVFADKACTNAEKLRGRVTPIRVHCCDAVAMDYSDGTVFFIYNSFGPQTLQAVLDNIRETAARHDRPLIFLYNNPIHSSVFQASGWLTYAGKKTDIFSKQRMELWTYGRPAA